MAAALSSRRSCCRSRPQRAHRTFPPAGSAAMAGGGEDGQQPAGADVAVGAGRRRVGIAMGRRSSKTA